MSLWSSWLAERSSDIASSHRVQLALTATVAAALGVSAVIGLQNARRIYSVYDLKESIPDLNSPHDVEKVAHHKTTISHNSLLMISPDQ